MEPDKKKNEETEIGRHLTDIKELPPAVKDVDKSSTLPVKEKTIPEKQIVEDKKPVKKENKQVKTDTIEKESFYSKKDIILGAVNFVVIAVIIFLLVKLPQKAKEYQLEKLREQQNLENPVVIFGDINDDKKKAQELSSLFLDESGIVNFVGDVEKLKSGESSIQRVTFANEKPVKDKTGFTGIPIVIELKGNWREISSGLEKVQNLDYLFRPSSVNVLPAKDEPGVLIFNYGAILYVDDKKMTRK